MAAGDRAAVFTLADEFGTPIAGAMRRHLRLVGKAAIFRDDLDGLVVDACMALYRLAPAWSPDGGAPPWVWARHRLHGLAAGHVGQWSDPFDPEEVELGTGRAPIGSWSNAGPASEPEPLEVLDGLAGVQPLCRLLQDALAEVRQRPGPVHRPRARAPADPR